MYQEHITNFLCVFTLLLVETSLLLLAYWKITDTIKNKILVKDCKDLFYLVSGNDDGLPYSVIELEVENLSNKIIDL